MTDDPAEQKMAIPRFTSAWTPFSSQALQGLLKQGQARAYQVVGSASKLPLGQMPSQPSLGDYGSSSTTTNTQTASACNSSASGSLQSGASGKAASGSAQSSTEVNRERAVRMQPPAMSHAPESSALLQNGGSEGDFASSKDTDSVSSGMLRLGRTGKRDSSWMQALPPADGWHSVVSHSCKKSRRLAEQWLVFEVADTGCGIAPEGLQSLFQQFVQGTEDEMQRPRSKGGTGLGLSICSKQVAVLGGQIGAISKVGAGSTFWFTIPLLLPDASSSHGGLRRTASWGSKDSFTDGHAAAGPLQSPKYSSTPTFGPLQPSNFRKFRRAQRLPFTGSCPQVFTEKQHEKFQHHQLQQKHDQRQKQQRARQDQPKIGDALRHNSAPAGPDTERIIQNSSPARHSAEGPRTDSALPASSFLLSVKGPSGASLAAAKALLAGRGFPSVTKHSSVANAQSARVSFELRESLKQEQRLRLREASKSGSLMDGIAYADPLTRRHRSSDFGGFSARQAVQKEHMQQRHLGGLGRDRKGAKKPAVRPSMEARRRQLDLSALKNKRVLLAEDNLINQAVARKMLTSLGMSCDVANNGQLAVEKVLTDPAFDIILMDMSMPVMGGVEATQELRRHDVRVPIVAMTANAADKDRDECLAAGMDGFLSKPVLRDRLADAVLRALSGRGRYYESDTVPLKGFEQPW